MRERDYILWTDVGTQTSTASYTYTLNTAYTACPSSTITSSTRLEPYVDCANYYVKCFREEHEDTTEWEHLLDEGGK